MMRSSNINNGGAAAVSGLMSLWLHYLSANMSQIAVVMPRPPANTIRSSNAGLMLGQRRRRWPNINPALGERIVFAEGGRVRFLTSIRRHDWEGMIL